MTTLLTYKPHLITAKSTMQTLCTVLTVLVLFTVCSVARQPHTGDWHCTCSKGFEFWRLSLGTVHQTAAELLATCTYMHTHIIAWPKVPLSLTCITTTTRLIGWSSGRTSVFGRRAFAVLRSTCSWWVTTYVGKPSAIGQPTKPTQPFILSGSINE